MNPNVILDLCSGSGSWSEPYKKHGYDVRQIDILDGIDIRLMEKLDCTIHGILAAPPCTALAVSGARWWAKKGNMALLESLSIVDACIRAVNIYCPKWWALENPIGRLSRYLGPPVMKFQPWEYGDPWTKRTCLWGHFITPTKSPVFPIEGGKIHRMPPSPERSRLRSITPPGFAKAFFEANP
ncbi:hypothetical protein LCGC14_2594400 [marine sediment metagenome]|uniref:DNA (cytosine-5-)-methyltransferase n=1 Tax=marine sediment metagenome TaxID=412755 RepID=A0A0F9CLP1_9ZZZZ